PRRVFAGVQDDREGVPSQPPRAVLAGQSVVYTRGPRSVMVAPLVSRGRVFGALTFEATDHRKYMQADLGAVNELARRIQLAIENGLLYRSAQDALHAREEFLAIAAHEIRGPVTALHLAAETLRRNPSERQHADRCLEIIHREDKRLAMFVDELLDVTR